jgi:hypothetical protein
MDRLLDLSKNSIQYGNSMCPSMIRKLKVIGSKDRKYGGYNVQVGNYGTSECILDFQ